MIRRLTGTIVEASDTTAVIDVGGIGYLVHTITLGTQLAEANSITLKVHHVVRENAQELYGFTSDEELEVFEMLLSLPKIGPKSAQQILTQASVMLIRESVVKDDPVYLSKMSGIGKKTAEKIVIGLRDNLEKYMATGGPEIDADQATTNVNTDVVDALIALGYTPQQARELAQQVPTDITDTPKAIKYALSSLNNS